MLQVHLRRTKLSSLIYSMRFPNEYGTQSTSTVLYSIVHYTSVFSMSTDASVQMYSTRSRQADRYTGQ